ncbi:MAG TPA: heavy metal translocating P-type ATPase [Bacteroidota bacterium]|nr:heavy metal translocating P-type ATPase [Bacteroidota bacterium]
MTHHTGFIVNGLCCATEESLIRKKLSSLPGVQDLRFNSISHRLDVTHTCGDDTILKALKDIGLPGTANRGNIAASHRSGRMQLAMTSLSGIFFALGLVLDSLAVPAGVSLAVYLLSIGLGGWRVALKGMKALQNLSLDMNFLMSIAVIGALALGHPAEGAAVIFLFSVSLLLESMSMDRGRRALSSLLKLAPLTATIREAGTEAVVPIENVHVGRTMIIRPGERIPLDGIVVAGFSSVDQSPITGESVPIAKSPGETVFAGSFNQRGVLEARVTKASADSTLATIIHMIEEAQSKKAPVQTFIERFAYYYTPAVFLAALSLVVVPPLLFGAPFDVWFYRGLVLLVIACPCALVISTPVSVVSALTSAARHGILIKGGRPLEQLASVQAVALDKTGTLTMGTPTITDIIAVDSLPPREILRITAAIELRSEHHLADAFLRKADQEGIDLDGIDVGQFDSLTGKGIKATVNSRVYWVGNHPLIEEIGLCSPDLESLLSSLEQHGKTAVVLTDESGPLGVIGIADQLRSESAQAVETLRAEGIQSVVLLTGDNRGAAEAIARNLGVDEARYELMPAEKLNAVRSLQSKYGRVAMVGDGINDGPALAAADVGIAMGGVGSDTALETSDVVLMSDNLMRIPTAIRLGKRALSVIRQNIIIALAVKALFLGLGVLGMTSLWLAILADDGATLVVILNSLRLLRNSWLPSERNH